MIIIAPDKFKGTLTAAQAAEAIAQGLRDAGVAERLLLCPMADGGDGTADVLRTLLPAGECVVESHACIGPQCFGSLPPHARSSHAFGEALREALSAHSHVYAAIGGTACCDGGAGLLQALGARFFNNSGQEITAAITPQILPEVARADFSRLVGKGRRITVLSDVRASLVPAGAGLSALDFALQKGFTADELPHLQDVLAAWHRLAAPQCSSPVDGAGGGTGFALASVLGARYVAGADFVLDCYRMPFAEARLVITGEGCIDRQTDSGKVVAAVVARATAAGTAVMAIGGKVLGKHPFPTIATMAAGDTPPASPAEAFRRLRNAAGTIRDL